MTGAIPPGVTRARWLAAAVAAALVVGVFFDVVFLGASFRPSRVAGMFTAVPEGDSPLPWESDRDHRDGFRDLGAAHWQMEPGTLFLRNALLDRASPYWNPYSGGGAPVFESPECGRGSLISLLEIALGADSRAFHWSRLLILVAALYCLYRSLHVVLGRSCEAALTGCVVFLLNGFHLSMLATQMVQPYVLAPIALHGLLRYHARPSGGRFALAALGQVVLLSSTFLPTALFMVGAVHALAAASALAHHRQPRPTLAAVAVQGASAALAFAAMAPIWFYAVTGVLTGDSWQHYASREVLTYTGRTALSLFGDRLLWGCHNWSGLAEATSVAPEFFASLGLIDLSVYHLGLVATLVAAHAVARRGSWREPLPLAAIGLLVVGLGASFGVPPFSFIHLLPVLSSIAVVYWGALWCFAFSFVAAYGMEALRERARPLATAGWLALVGGLSLWSATAVGWPGVALALPRLARAGVILVLAVGAVAVAWRWPRRAAVARGALVALAFLELFLAMNHVRPRQADVFALASQPARARVEAPASAGPPALVDASAELTDQGLLVLTTTWSGFGPRVARPLSASWRVVDDRGGEQVMLAPVVLSRRDEGGHWWATTVRRPKLSGRPSSVTLSLEASGGTPPAGLLLPPPLPLAVTPRSGRYGLVEYLGENVGEGRVLNLGTAGLYANWGSAFRIPQLGKMDAHRLGWYDKFFHHLIGGEWHFLTLGTPLGWPGGQEPSFWPNPDALGFLGVKYLVVDRARPALIRRLAAHDALSWVFDDGRVVVFACWLYRSRASVVFHLTRGYSTPFDLGLSGRHDAVTGDPELLAAARAAGVWVHDRATGHDGDPAGASGAVTISSFANGRVALAVTASRPAVVVLADTWHPSWRATVDGAPASLARVNQAFRGVVVPAGAHEVVMSYHPAHLRWLLALSAAALVCLVVVAVVAKR